jgi:trans-2-enoyl-CoA reductase
MARNRLKGKSIVFSVEGTDYTLDATSIALTHEEADDDEVTFADAAAGGAYDWKMTISALQSTDADALHTFFWTHAGESIDFVFGPNGNAVPTVAQPHFTGTVKLDNKLPDIGGDADSTWTFEKELEVDGPLVRKTTA